MKSLALVLTCIGSTAFAHGTIPTSNTISFTPEGSVFLGMNFGAVVIGAQQEFICERAVSGEQTSVDVWQWLPGGKVAGIVTTGGFIKGVFMTAEGGCGFEVVSGTEMLLMTDLVPNPLDPNGFVAVGTTKGSDSEARLVRTTTTGTDILAAAPGAVPTGVRAGGGDVYAVFATIPDAASPPTTFELVHVGATTTERRTLTNTDGDKNLRPLGVDPSNPATAWFVRSTQDNDVVLRTDDGGTTLEPVFAVAARIGGFAIKGSKVWLQSSVLGIHVAPDGRNFTLISKSPHGSCLAIGPDQKLYACGVPWQDFMAVGVSSNDGEDFEPIIGYFDAITNALDCPATHDLCTEELSFLREYYGFGPALVEEGAAEVVESVEPGPDDDAETNVAEPTTPTTSPEPKPKDDDCSGGAGGGLISLAALAASRALRRRMTKSPPDRAAHAG